MQKIVSALRTGKVRHKHDAINKWSRHSGDTKATYEQIERACRLLFVPFQTLTRSEKRELKRLTFLLERSGVKIETLKPKVARNIFTQQVTRRSFVCNKSNGYK